MKSFKFIREGNSVEPGVSQIDDVPEDPMSFIEIKPKKTKVVKSDLKEAVSVKKTNYSWGKMMTVHHGANTSYPLHPEHQQAIAKLGDGEKTSFKDETNTHVVARRDGDKVHLSQPKKSSTMTTVAHSHFNEETVVETKGAPKGFHFTKDGKLKRGDANQDGDGGPMLRSDPLDKQRSKVPAVSEEAKLDENDLKSQMAAFAASRGGRMTTSAERKQSTAELIAKREKEAAGRLKAEPQKMASYKPLGDRDEKSGRSYSEGVDFLKVWNNIKPVYEAVKTTHEDPLVVTRDAEGYIHTHANLSVANNIHGTDVKHQAIHSGKPVKGGKYTFELSQHHEGALKEDAPFDPVAHKKEHDRLMGKHIEAHKAVSKAFADMKAQGKSPRFDIPENDKLNAIKKEIDTHNAKVPRGPAPAPGSAAHYYASKKPGEYTGD